MAFIDIFAFIVILLVILTALIVFVIFAMAPGNVAKSRNHPQAEAIKIGGWVSLICGGFLWPIVMIWAFTKPSGASASGDTTELEARCNALEKKLASMEKALKGAK